MSPNIYVLVMKERENLRKSNFPKGTISVKFEIYVCQMIIFRGGVFDNCPTYFLSPYYYIYIYIYIKATLY
jgi:hypothetical protein